MSCSEEEGKQEAIPMNHQQEMNHLTHCISGHNVGTSTNPQPYEIAEPVKQRLHNTALCTMFSILL